jgi:hypothetical protein
LTLSSAVTPETQMLYAVLRLPAFEHPVCHGYRNACVCHACMKRERKAAKPETQPWHARAAA